MEPTRLCHPRILQVRTLEWIAISFSNAWKWKVKVKSLSCVLLFATPWTAAYQAPPSMGFSRQEYWSGVPLPSPILHIPNFKISQCRLMLLMLCCFWRQYSKWGRMGDGKPFSGFALLSCWNFAASRGFLPSRQCSIPRLVIGEISDFFSEKTTKEQCEREDGRRTCMRPWKQTPSWAC